MEKVNKNDATTIENEAVIDPSLSHEELTSVDGWTKTILSLKREPFESNKDKGKTLYSYGVLYEMRKPDGRLVKEFNINMIPTFKRDENNVAVKEFGIYVVISSIFEYEGDSLPLFVRESSFTNDQGEIITTRKFCVMSEMADGLLLQTFAPRGQSDKTVLKLATDKYFKKV